MKKLSIYLFLLLFTLQIPSQADDIRDFQIEGMSLGDSLLKFFDEKDIDRDYVFPNKKFATYADVGINFETYKGFQVFYYDDDKNFIIQYIAGKILYEDSIAECYKKMNEIVVQLKEILSNAEVNDEGIRKHDKDKSGKSTAHQMFFNLDDGSEISVAYTDWDMDMQKDGSHADNLAVALRSKEFAEWLNSDEAYKPD